MTPEPLSMLDHIRKSVNSATKRTDRAEIGQFLTPAVIAHFMASIYDPSRVQAPFVSFENHLNYIHREGKGLPVDLAKGLALYLNSTIVDRYFRLFSGHTQVNATDLRKMPYPTHEKLLRLGSHVEGKLPDQESIDAIIEKECLNGG